jgi:hypothetical protein
VADKAELVITALQQRMGELVSNYETQIAILRAEITQLVQERDRIAVDEDEKQQAVDAYSEKLSNITAD